MNAILVLFHCGSNTGYAIEPLENIFYKMAMALCLNDASRVHFAYPAMSNGPSAALPADFRQYAIIDSTTDNVEHCRDTERYIRKHGIDVIFGFDQPVHRPIYRYFRRAGVRHFIAYWGAPMSSMNNLAIRLIKRIGVNLRRAGPDHYIFESRGMAELAERGRGIPRARISVVPLGVDCQRYRPDSRDAPTVYQRLSIPRHRNIFFYSGHMESRKGVSVIIGAANRVSARRNKDDWHILLCGDKGEERFRYLNMLTETARDHVTFGGYRSDLEQLHRGCYAGIIASSGWDSFTMSAIEMQASGLPVLVSHLTGLAEAVEDGVTGLRFPPGNSDALAEIMEHLLDDLSYRDRLSLSARTRAEQTFSAEIQLASLTEIVKNHLRTPSPQHADGNKQIPTGR